MVKIGLLGAGHLGKIHIKCLKSIEEFEFVGFYDSNAEIRETVSKEYNIKSFNSMAELIDAVDAVDIVTTTTNHFECAVAALKKDKHLFIEKPVVSTYQEAEQLEIFAQHSKSLIQIGHVERFNPAFIAVQDIINGPIFMEAHRLAPYYTRGTDVSVILDLMIHDIDILLHTVKSKITHVSACGVPIVSKTTDIANARVEFENGATANLTASRLSMKKMRKTRIFQPNNYILIDYLNQVSEVTTIDDNPDYNDPFALIIEDADGYKSPRQLKFSKPKIQKINSIETELRCFHNSIVNNVDTLVNLNDGIAALKLAIQINDIVKQSSDNFF